MEQGSGCLFVAVATPGAEPACADAVYMMLKNDWLARGFMHGD